MEVNMPLAMPMLLYWNPTGPEKEDMGAVSTLLTLPAWKQGSSGEDQLTEGLRESLALLVHCIIVYLELALGFYFSGVYTISH